ncbi:hypothetical protein [Mixta calida]|uniref:hypothetical protein n=1 Tax=Mixta calida TaxID=665913 RepID=UPI0028998B91|nr:hypothetical protein [Mixta calida]MDU4289729.1 hypothetical protein [Mixta calida]
MAADKTLDIEMAYGDSFPHGEPIPAARQALFAPLVATNGAGQTESFPINSENTGSAWRILPRAHGW